MYCYLKRLRLIKFIAGLALVVLLWTRLTILMVVVITNTLEKPQPWLALQYQVKKLVLLPLAGQVSFVVLSRSRRRKIVDRLCYIICHCTFVSCCMSNLPLLLVVLVPSAFFQPKAKYMYAPYEHRITLYAQYTSLRSHNVWVIIGHIKNNQGNFLTR